MGGEGCKLALAAHARSPRIAARAGSSARVEPRERLLVVRAEHRQLQQALRKVLERVHECPSAVPTLQMKRERFAVKALKPRREFVLFVGDIKGAAIGLDEGGLHNVDVAPLLAPQAHELGDVGQTLALGPKSVFPQSRCFKGLLL